MGSSNEEKWEKLIQEMQGSGKSQKKWCQEKGLSYHTLKYWKQRLSHQANSFCDENANKETTWLKVEVKPEAVLMPQITERIEVYLGNYRIIVPDNFNKVSMASIIEVLTQI